MRKEIFEIIGCVLMVVVGQMLLKYTMMSVGQVSVGSIWSSMPRVVANPFAWLSLLCFSLTAVVWISVLSRVPLSYAYPLFSLAYVLAALGATVFYKEKLSLIQWTGILFIVLGCTLIARSPVQTNA